MLRPAELLGSLPHTHRYYLQLSWYQWARWRDKHEFSDRPTEKGEQCLAIIGRPLCARPSHAHMLRLTLGFLRIETCKYLSDKRSVVSCLSSVHRELQWETELLLNIGHLSVESGDSSDLTPLGQALSPSTGFSEIAA
jgi:hypothetical protein